MTFRSLRFASRLCGALILLVLLAHVAGARQAKDPPKDPPKKDAPKESPEEQKAKEAFLAGKLDDALKALQALAKTNPTLAPPKVIVARWCVETKQGPQARVLLEQAAAEDPAHPEVLLTNASFALAEGRITDTILSCHEALRFADNPRWDADRKKGFLREARTGLIAGYEARGDFASVKPLIEALLAADPNNAPLRQRLARTNFLLNNPDTAFADLQAAFKIDPTLDPPELGMAQMWTQKQDFAKADEWYGKAAAAHKDSAKVHRGFAGYLLSRGRMDVAKAHLAAAKKLDQNSRDTKALEGLFARYAKDYATALPIFEELVRDYPSDPFAAANLALVLAEVGDAKGKGRAIALASNHVNQNQRSGEAWAIAAYTLYKADRKDEAAKAAQTAATAGAINADGAYFVAKIFADRGNIEDAHKIIKAACESKEGFVYRKVGEALLAELDKKVPMPPKKP
jgi:predicted Zn-dependent protease